MRDTDTTQISRDIFNVGAPSTVPVAGFGPSRFDYGFHRRDIPPCGSEFYSTAIIASELYYSAASMGTKGIYHLMSLSPRLCTRARTYFIVPSLSNYSHFRLPSCPALLMKNDPCHSLTLCFDRVPISTIYVQCRSLKCFPVSHQDSRSRLLPMQSHMKIGRTFP
jgi:hypothetical protein